MIGSCSLSLLFGRSLLICAELDTAAGDNQWFYPVSYVHWGWTRIYFWNIGISNRKKCFCWRRMAPRGFVIDFRTTPRREALFENWFMWLLIPLMIINFFHCSPLSPLQTERAASHILHLILIKWESICGSVGPHLNLFSLVWRLCRPGWLLCKNPFNSCFGYFWPPFLETSSLLSLFLLNFHHPLCLFS